MINTILMVFFSRKSQNRSLQNIKIAIGIGTLCFILPMAILTYQRRQLCGLGSVHNLCTASTCHMYR